MQSGVVEEEGVLVDPEVVEDPEEETDIEELSPAVELQQDPVYHKLVEECRRSVGNIIQRYWEIGGKIAKFLDRGGRAERYGKKLYAQLSRDIGIDSATLYQARAFALGVPKEELKQFLELPWYKTRRMTPLLENPEAREAVVGELEVVKEKDPQGFQEWLKDAYKEHLGREYKPRGRKQGQKTDFLKSLQKLAIEGELEPEIREFETEEGKGFVAAVSWREGQDTQAVRKMLEELLARLSE